MCFSDLSYKAFVSKSEKVGLKANNIQITICIKVKVCRESALKLLDTYNWMQG